MHTAENDMLDYNYPYDELPQLKELLEKWGLQCVYQPVWVRIQLNSKFIILFTIIYSQ